MEGKLLVMKILYLGGSKTTFSLKDKLLFFETLQSLRFCILKLPQNIPHQGTSGYLLMDLMEQERGPPPLFP